VGRARGLVQPLPARPRGWVTRGWVTPRPACKARTVRSTWKQYPCDCRFS